MLNSPMLSIFQHLHAIPLRSPLISLRSKWRLTGFSRRFTPKNPVRLHKPFGQLPRRGAKNVLPLNLIALPFGGSSEGNRGMPAAIEPCSKYRSAAPSSHFVRNGVSLDFRVASLLKIKFACTYAFAASFRRADRAGAVGKTAREDARSVSPALNHRVCFSPAPPML